MICTSADFEEPDGKNPAFIIEVIDFELDNNPGNAPRPPNLQKFLEEERAKVRRWLAERQKRESEQPPESST